jgi:uncharacterized protein YukE
MSESTTPAPPAPIRRRAIPFATSILITLLAVACVAEGFLIYLKQLQVMASSQITEQVAGTIAKYKRDLEQTTNSFQQFVEVVGSSDLPHLQEQAKGAKPPTVEGYLSELESKLQTTLSKLDEMQSGWTGMGKARDDAIKAQVASDTELKRKADEFHQTADLLAKQLQAEKDARQKDVTDLQQKVADEQKKVKDADEVSSRAAKEHNDFLEAFRKTQERVDRLRLLLAQTLRVPPPPGLSPALVANDRLELRVAAAESVQNISYVRFAIPADRPLDVGMRFLILDSQRRTKCLVTVTNVLSDKALAQVMEKYSAEPASTGDLAELDLAYEEVRKPPPAVK